MSGMAGITHSQPRSRLLAHSLTRVSHLPTLGSSNTAVSLSLSLSVSSLGEGHIEVLASLSRAWFCPGDDITVALDINNNTNRIVR